MAHHLGLFLYQICRVFWFTRKSMGPNPGGFGSNLSCNITISPNTTKFFTYVLTCLLTVVTDTYPNFINKVQWAKSHWHCSAHWNTQKTCWDNSVDGILHCRPSSAHAVQRPLLFSVCHFCFWEFGVKGIQSRLCLCFYDIIYNMESNLEWGAQLRSRCVWELEF